MRKIMTLLLVSALVVLAAAGAFAQEADEWSQYQKDRANTGYLDVTVPDKGNVSGQTPGIGARDGSQPVVAGNRAFVYTGVDDTSGSVVCIDLFTGKKAWETGVEPPTLGSWSSPAVSGGLVYIGSGSKVYALNMKNGSVVWKKDLGPDSVVVNSSPTVDGDRLVIGDWNNANKGRYVCLNSLTGAVLWEFALDKDTHAQSTAAVDGNRIYVGQFSALFGTPNGKVWCLSRSTGKPVTSWGTNGYFRTKDSNDVTGSVTVSGDHIYFTDFTFGAATEPNSNLYCLRKDTGKQVWRTAVYPSSGAPAVGGGIVVVACNQWGNWPEPSTNWTYAFSSGSGSGAAGTRLWEKKDIGGFNMSAAVTGGKVLVGNFDANDWQNEGVCCLDADNGKTVWSSEEAGSAPVPTEYGVLSIGGGKVTTFSTRSTKKGEFYFAEGTTRAGYQEWICLQNATKKTVKTNIRYMLSDGTRRDQPVTLPPESRTTVDVNLFLGPGCDAAAHVTGDGPFVAERAMYVDTNGISGGEQVMGMAEPGRTFLFAEGTTRAGYQTWLALQNPGDSAAEVLITYLYQGKEPRAENVIIPATSRRTVDVNVAAGAEEDVSIAVTANRDIVAERVMYFKDVDPLMGERPNGVHNSTGAAQAGKSWYFAEGTTRGNFREWLCLMNPGGEPVKATVRYMTFDRGVITREKDLPPNSRTTVDVGADVGAETDLSMYVTSDRPMVAERPMYFQYMPGNGGLWGGGHNTVGTPHAAYRWEFAEGTTREGFNTYLCIANPNSRKVEVTVEYITNTDGRSEKKTGKVKVSGSSRYTIDVNQVIGGGKDVSLVVSGPLPVVAERAMYFDNGVYVGGGASPGFVGTP